MNNKILRIIMVLLFIMILPCFAFCETESGQSPDSFCLNEADVLVGKEETEISERICWLSFPSGLELIGEEAFEGTAFTNISIPKSVKEIKERAFAGIKQLREAYISGESTYISDSVFDEDEFVVLSGFEDSYAQQWSYYRGIRFIVLEQIRKTRNSAGIVYPPEEKEKRTVSTLARSFAFFTADKSNVRRNSGRTDADIKGSYYTGKSSVYVWSRYFP